jgi:hypothetical protein
MRNCPNCGFLLIERHMPGPPASRCSNSECGSIFDRGGALAVDRGPWPSEEEMVSLEAAGSFARLGADGETTARWSWG